MNNKKRIKIIGKNILIIYIFLAISGCKNNYTGCNSAGISQSEFNNISIGDSQFKISSIIDQNDDWENDDIYDKCVIEISNEKNNRVYSYTYKYLGEKRGYALITYTADYSNGDLFVLPTVSKKEQFNIK